MVISDLQYLESVETSTLLGGGKKKGYAYGKKGKYSYPVFGSNSSIINLTQINVSVFGKNVTQSNSADIDVDQEVG